MIIVNIKGGLGNQMFEYAFARSLEHKIGTEFKLDLRGLNTPAWVSKRSFGLEAFNTSIQLATPEEVAWYTRRRDRSLRTRITNLFRTKTPAFIADVHGYDESYLRAPKDAYFDGHWEDERYFKDISDIIRHDFTLKKPMSAEGQALLTSIKSKPAVSIQVRRGDNVTNADSIARVGSQSLEYYHAALEYLASVLPDANLFVFSDDIPWARENIKSPFKQVTYVTRPTLPFYEEIPLMSACQHHIISNSTFAWWGAWLDPKHNKIVIAPKRWFKSDGLERWNSIVPPNWKRM